MKAVLLAGGLGTRLSEETHLRPKPMVEIGGMPILWHIMKVYHTQGIREFVICLGYKGYMIKEYFQNYALHQADITFDMRTGEVIRHRSGGEDWRVTLVETGEKAMTGARVRRALEFVGSEDFCLTYGDGLADINIGSLLEFHRDHGKLATLTAVSPPGRFGALRFAGGAANQVEAFMEKPAGDGGLINGGFFVLSPEVAKYIGPGDDEVWERGPLERLASSGQLMAYRHRGFWRPMDTRRDKDELQELWDSGRAPWKSWS